jgi:Uma2 family endonuclease
MKVDFPDDVLPIKFALDPERPMNDDEYFNFCMANPDVRFERTAQGEIVVVPPAGFESGYQSGDVFGELRNWAKRDRRGKASGPDAEFILPTGAAFAPDAAWVSNSRLAKHTREELRKFPHLCPEFVIEVMSPSDRLRAAQHKMEEWMRAGVELAWLIHPDKETVYVYRAGKSEAEVHMGIVSIAGEGPVDGFELDLTDIWAGL